MTGNERAFVAWASPEEAGVSSAGLLRFLDEVENNRDRLQFHSLVLLRHGKTVCRLNWAPYDDLTPHALFSLSKSFCSAAAGFAVAEGLLSWDSPVAEVLAEDVPDENREELADITLEHLLCMGSGLDPASDCPPADFHSSWARHVLSHHVLHKPMEHFHYNTFGTYLVSCMLQKATGRTVRDYLMPRLFTPLGIEKPDWAESPQGVSCGGFGLRLPAEAIARFGQCLLQRGVWQGRQVLPEGWVERASRCHIDNSNGHPDPDNEWNQGYGYQFWRCTEGRWRGDGAHGQVCMVDEKNDAVLAATCETTDMGLEFSLIRRFLFPAFDAAPGTRAEQEAFRKRAEGLGYPVPTDDGSGVPLPEGTFAPRQENRYFSSVTLKQAGEGFITIALGEGEAVLLGRGAWHRTEGTDSDAFGLPMTLLGAYGWEQGKLHAVVRCPQDPLTLDLRIRWEGDRMFMAGYGIDAPGGQLELIRKPE
ncbi:MAG: serine hydrolase [Clostridia bacterium]|nr:serine hydrolase [Clostridia bacterium]